MKKSLLTLAVLVAVGATGCTTLNNAGHTAYKVMPVDTKAGTVCSLEVADGKERKEEAIQFDGGNCQFATGGKDVKAFKGQGVAAKAAQPLPTLLGDILNGDK